MKNKYTILSLLCFPLMQMAHAIEAPNGQAEPAPMPAVKGKQIDQKPYLGVYTENIHPMLKAQLPQLESGAMIMKVMPESVADKAGLEAYDLLLKVDGKPITGPADLHQKLLDKKVGDIAKITYLRGGKESQCDAKLEARPANFAANFGGMPLGQLGDIPEQDLQRIEKLLRNVDRKMGLGAPDGLPGQLMLDGGGNFKFQLNGEIVNPQFMQQAHIDENGKIQIEGSGKERTVKLFDKEGELLFEGPFNTNQDLEAMPEVYRNRLKDKGIDPEAQSARLFNFEKP